MLSGFLVVDKPAGITSHDVVAALRAASGIKKVGHTGTLDPFATGVLPLAMGGATRLIEFLDESIKVYDALIQLGATTDTGDPTGQVVEQAPVPSLSEAQVREVLAGFVGPRMQVPPAYSAVKVDGKPLYHYARKGEEKVAAARPILLHGMELLELGSDQLSVRMTCSRGTYARVLADDIARALGTVGHLAALVRPRSGPFLLEQAVGMGDLAEATAAESGHPWEEVLLRRGGGARLPWRRRDEVLGWIRDRMIPALTALCHLPTLELAAADARRIRQGGAPPAPPPGVEDGGRYLLVQGPQVLAVAERTPRGPSLIKVLDDDGRT